MLEHATLATAAAGGIGLCFGGALGVMLSAALHGSKITALIATIAARDLTLDARERKVNSLTKEANHLGYRCTELRLLNAGLRNEIERLTPLAARGQRAIDQQHAAAKAAAAARTAVAKAKRVKA